MFIKQINFFGAAVSTNACYFVAVFFNLVYIIKENGANADGLPLTFRARYCFYAKTTAIAFFAVAVGALMLRLIEGAVGFCVGSAVSVMLFFALVVAFKVFANDEAESLRQLFKRFKKDKKSR